MNRILAVALVLLCCTCKRTRTDAKPEPHALDGVLDGLASKDAQAYKQAAGALAKLLNEGELSPAVVEPRTGRVAAALHGALKPYPHGRVTSHGTATFSTFARADEKTAEQYVADVRSLIDHANKNIDPKTKTAPMPKSK